MGFPQPPQPPPGGPVPPWLREPQQPPAGGPERGPGPLRRWFLPTPTPGQAADPNLATLVAVLNLTGLGLGYLVLRRWVAAAFCWVVTLTLVGFAVPAIPDGLPLGVLVGYLTFLACAACHGAALGRYAQRPLLQPSRAGALLGLTALVVPLAAGFGYLEAAQRELLDRLAQADALVRDAADEQFGTAKPRYHRALATYAYIADVGWYSRAADRLPDRLGRYYRTVAAPYADKSYCQAVDPLKDLRTVPDSIPRDYLGALATWPDGRLATSWYECGTGQLGKVGAVAEKGGDLYELLTVFPRSEPAKKVAPAVRAAIARNAARIRGDEPCAAVDALEVLADQAKALPGDGTGAGDAYAEDARTANAHVEPGTYACGIDQYEDDDFDAAEKTMKAFAARYPKNEHRGYAKKVAIAAEIAQLTPSAGERLPTNASGGSVRLVIVNDSPEAKTLLYTGRVTGSVTIRACGSCSPFPGGSYASQFACSRPGKSYPADVVRLPRGTLYTLHKSASNPPNASRYRVTGNAKLCLYSTW